MTVYIFVDTIISHVAAFLKRTAVGLIHLPNLIDAIVTGREGSGAHHGRENARLAQFGCRVCE